MTFFEKAAAVPGQALPLGAYRPALSQEKAHAHVWSARERCLAAFSLVIFASLAYACWFVHGTVVPWDSKNQFYPFFRFLGDALQRGEIPLWNPYHFAGHPAVADPQSLIFTPSMLLFALIAPHASMQVFDAVIMAHLLAGGLGVLCIFHLRRWHPAGAVLAAAIFMLGGAASARLQHTGMIISYAYFPLALWSLEHALDRRSYRFAALFGVFAALMALGRDQVAFLLCALLCGWVVWTAITSKHPLRYMRTHCGVVLFGFGVLAAALLVPSLLTMQFLAASNRPAIPYGVAVAGSLAPVNLITLFVPNFFGSLDQLYDYWGPSYPTMPRTDWTDRAINYLFIGTLPILLITWHGLAGGRLFERPIRLFTLVLALALIYALGRYTPFFSEAFDFIPGVSLYRRPADATFLINIALALSAGYLLHRYVKDGLPRPHLHLTRPLAFVLGSVILLGIAVLVGTALAFSYREHRLATSLDQLAQAAALALTGAGLIYFLRDAKHRAYAAALFVVLGCGEIIWRNADSSLNGEPLSRYSVFDQISPGDANGIKALKADIDSKIAAGEYPRVEILGLPGPWQNASMVFKLENTLGYNPLRIDEFERAVGPGENAQDLNLRHFPGTFRGYKSTLAALLGLEYLVLDRPLIKLPHHVPRPTATTLLYSSDKIFIYRLGMVAPRSYFASEIKPVDSDSVLDEQSLPDFDRSRQVLIDHSDLLELQGGYQSPLIIADEPEPAAIVEAPKTSVQILSYEDGKVSLDVDADKTGIVVLHDLYYPGWEVRVDGEKKPILRANLLFRGVEVGPGHHRVEFSFHPLSFANLEAAFSALLHKNEE